jgi:ABC-type nitrate/sulfonate/bicarbonate transport system substrate-binding protein
VSKEGVASYFQWLKSEYGFSESKVKPYTFNSQPFIVNKQSAMQGYVTSEPYAVEKAAGFKPGVILLADHGFNAYSTLIETRREIVDKKPDLVQRFVDASAIGWYNYLYGDNSAGNAMIKKMNPEMTDELLGYSVAKMKEYGIVDSGDTLRDGIGAMTTRAWRASSTRWCGPAWFAAISITARPTRCASSTRASASICGRRTDARWPSPLCPWRISMRLALPCVCAP